MTPIELLKERHAKALEKLRKAAARGIDKYGMMPCAYAVASRLNISYQTVINYHSGKTNDGFLTEAITKEFKSLKL